MFFVVLSINFYSFLTNEDGTCYAMPCQTSWNHDFDRLSISSTTKVFIRYFFFVTFWVHSIVLRIDLDLKRKVAFVLKSSAFYHMRILQKFRSAIDTSFSSSIIHWRRFHLFGVLVTLSFHHSTHRRFWHPELFCYSTWWHMSSWLIFLWADHLLHKIFIFGASCHSWANRAFLRSIDPVLTNFEIKLYTDALFHFFSGFSSHILYGVYCLTW